MDWVVKGLGCANGRGRNGKAVAWEQKVWLIFSSGKSLVLLGP